jgi:serine/threonine-protein phosphatase 2A regulatory subunit A
MHCANITLCFLYICVCRFTTRVSACGLFHNGYNSVSPEIQSELRSLFNNLCNDDTPMVRKAAFQNLGKFALALQKQYFKSDIYPIVKAVSIDDIDSMRIYSIDACAALSKTVDSTEFSNIILPIIEALQDDNSWRVRQSLATNFAAVASNINVNSSSSANESIGKKLMQVYCKLLKDKESEVRVAACEKLESSAAAIRYGLSDYLSPVLESLSVDPVQNVRVAFSCSVIGLCNIFGKETSAKLLVPIVQQLTKDEYYEVRNNILNRLELLNECIGAAGISKSILPALIDLAKDPKWRVRMGVIEKSYLLAKSLGLKNFTETLQPLLIQALSDHVYAIREIAAEQIGLISREFGGKWAAQSFLPEAFLIYNKQTNYLHRMTCLLVAEKCAVAGGVELIEKSLLPITINASTDDVANVRIAAAKTLLSLIDQFLAANQKASAQQKITPLLKKLITDNDPDVNYFSNLAYQKLQ